MGNIFLHVACITTHLKHCHATKFRCCKLKQHVASSWTGVYFFQQIFSTCSNKFCCVTMFVVGGNTCNNAFQLAMQHCCVASCSNLLLVLLSSPYELTKLIYYSMCSVTILYITSTVQTHYLPSQLYYSFHPKNQGHCLTWDFGQQYTCKVLLQVSGGGDGKFQGGVPCYLLTAWSVYIDLSR